MSSDKKEGTEKTATGCPELASSLDISIDATVAVLKPDKVVQGGLYIPERPVFRLPERKSNLGK